MFYLKQNESPLPKNWMILQWVQCGEVHALNALDVRISSLLSWRKRILNNSSFVAPNVVRTTVVLVNTPWALKATLTTSAPLTKASATPTLTSNYMRYSLKPSPWGVPTTNAGHLTEQRFSLLKSLGTATRWGVAVVGNFSVWFAPKAWGEKAKRPIRHSLTGKNCLKHSLKLVSFKIQTNVSVWGSSPG